MKKIYVSLFVSLLLSACSSRLPARVSTESLISASAEKVSFALVNSDSINSISSWIADDKPTNAEISCINADMICLEAQHALKQSSVPFKMAETPNGSDSVTLMYERVTARNCSTRGFGCAVSANSVQMVPGLTQFTSPKVSGFASGEGAVAGYKRYVK